MSAEERQAVAAQNLELVRAYKVTFETVAGEAVLDDLARYCRAGHRSTCAVPGEPDRTFLLLGRNDVYRHIRWLMGITPDQLAVMNGGITPEEDENG